MRSADSEKHPTQRSRRGFSGFDGRPPHIVQRCIEGIHDDRPLRIFQQRVAQKIRLRHRPESGITRLPQLGEEATHVNWQSVHDPSPHPKALVNSTRRRRESSNARDRSNRPSVTLSLACMANVNLGQQLQAWLLCFNKGVCLLSGGYMRQYTHGWKTLHAAMNTLAGASDQKQRLESAIIFNLVQITPENDLPPAIRQDFITFMKEMHSHNRRDSEGAVWDAITLLDEIGRQRAITRIIGFYDVVSWERGRNEGQPLPVTHDFDG